MRITHFCLCVFGRMCIVPIFTKGIDNLCALFLLFSAAAAAIVVVVRVSIHPSRLSFFWNRIQF